MCGLATARNSDTRWRGEAAVACSTSTSGGTTLLDAFGSALLHHQRDQGPTHHSTAVATLAAASAGQPDTAADVGKRLLAKEVHVHPTCRSAMISTAVPHAAAGAQAPPPWESQLLQWARRECSAGEILTWAAVSDRARELGSTTGTNGTAQRKLRLGLAGRWAGSGVCISSNAAGNRWYAHSDDIAGEAIHQLYLERSRSAAAIEALDVGLSMSDDFGISSERPAAAVLNEAAQILRAGVLQAPAPAKADNCYFPAGVNWAEAVRRATVILCAFVYSVVTGEPFSCDPAPPLGPPPGADWAQHRSVSIAAGLAYATTGTPGPKHAAIAGYLRSRNVGNGVIGLLHNAGHSESPDYAREQDFAHGTSPHATSSGVIDRLVQRCRARA